MPSRTTLPALVAAGAVAALAVGVSCGGGAVPEAGGTHEEGRLAPCPSSPNCVSSQAADADHRVEPLRVTIDPDSAWQLAVAIVEESARTEIVEHRPQNGYLHATYRSAVFRFVDDLELLLDRDGHVIHVRSASRLGHYDFGANANRVEALREELRRRQERESSAPVESRRGTSS
jgi:uncharacterized protein (DUF1499 family)